MLNADDTACYIDKSHHDKVVQELPKNANIVLKSDKVDVKYIPGMV
ncbi:MAG: hypothetical protein KBC30_10850 [Planctomycetes bacterium]|jgi:hypothetical protein|nr:hypothetical protein [Planctomycetota bacterium]HNZ67000.1 hypothetical protein [Planctomycetota bacterium]HON45777.1 hypothetical protein [Planctomycetota bacterium]HPY74053.1 hypothetical protein [Planctomycetota bacterium]HRU52497.1 hypothetical protein [Planctomycetota bacterium]